MGGGIGPAFVKCPTIVRRTLRKGNPLQQYFTTDKRTHPVYTIQDANSSGFQEFVVVAKAADGSLTIVLYPPNHKIGPGERF